VNPRGKEPERAAITQPMTTFSQNFESLGVELGQRTVCDASLNHFYPTRRGMIQKGLVLFRLLFKPCCIRNKPHDLRSLCFDTCTERFRIASESLCYCMVPARLCRRPATFSVCLVCHHHRPEFVRPVRKFGSSQRLSTLNELLHAVACSLSVTATASPSEHARIASGIALNLHGFPHFVRVCRTITNFSGKRC